MVNKRGIVEWRGPCQGATRNQRGVAWRTSGTGSDMGRILGARWREGLPDNDAMRCNSARLLYFSFLDYYTFFGMRRKRPSTQIASLVSHFLHQKVSDPKFLV